MLTSDLGGEVLSNEFQSWLKASGIYQMTAAGREPNYNTVIERASAILENMSFATVHYAHKPKYTKI